ncbi:type I-E CRISPR-associated protein Cse2/CasB [Lactobacillus agrestimuris]|uniref:type I-E CRISPR-associated protein Cse2/CasB n=1 Tax=Lactobacillus agrestimuris TaxID=2941328 RepID=UPI002042E470|nr:type I-E CRISPR-associated protein Cse2/CasB [Lactobacillus agrestimuris]
MNNRHKLAYIATANIIENLFNDGNVDSASLASFRNSKTMSDPHAEQVWPIIFAYTSNLYERNKEKDGIDTIVKRGENSIFTALHCYAIYQQGNQDVNTFARLVINDDTDSKEQKGIPLFRALNNLQTNNENIRPALNKRVDTLLASTDPNKILDLLPKLVRILKSNLGEQKPKIDFAQLAEDFNHLQIGYESERQICIKWGREYFYSKDKL